MLQPQCGFEFFIQGKIPVFIISQKGMAYGGEVAADLMHTACPQFQFQKGTGNVVCISCGKKLEKCLGFF